MATISKSKFACGEVRELSDAWGYDELLMETHSRVRWHIGICEECRSFLHGKMELRKRVRITVKADGVPAALYGNVKSALRRYRSFI